MTRLEALEEILGEFGLNIRGFEGCNHTKYLGVGNDNAIIARVVRDNDTEQYTIDMLINCLQSHIEVMINRKMRKEHEQI